MHRFDFKTIQYVELRLITFKTTLNYESDQIIMHCNDLTSKRSKKLSYVPKLQKWSNYNALQRFDIKTIKNVELHRKTFKTTQNYKTDQITMNCIDLTFKRWKLPSDVAKLQKSLNYNELHRFDVRTIKILSYVAKHSKQRKTTKWSNYNELHRFDVETIETTQNYKRDQIMINLHRFDVKTIKNVELRLKKIQKNAKLQNWSKIKKRWVTLQNIQNNAKLQNWSNNNALHRFDVKTIKTFELGGKIQK